MADTVKTKTLAPADGGAAFPTSRVVLNGQDALDGVEIYGPGMSLRDWFAGQVIGSACTFAFANIQSATEAELLPEEWAAKIALRVADELLAARKAGA